MGTGTTTPWVVQAVNECRQALRSANDRQAAELVCEWAEVLYAYKQHGRCAVTEPPDWSQAAHLSVVPRKWRKMVQAADRYRRIEQMNGLRTIEFDWCESASSFAEYVVYTVLFGIPARETSECC